MKSTLKAEPTENPIPGLYINQEGSIFLIHKDAHDKNELRSVLIYVGLSNLDWQIGDTFIPFMNSLKVYNGSVTIQN